MNSQNLMNSQNQNLNNFFSWYVSSKQKGDISTENWDKYNHHLKRYRKLAIMRINRNNNLEVDSRRG